MTEETIRFLVGSISVNLKSKFRIDENGLWYNERLEIESEKRAKFTESRRNNGILGGRPNKSKKPNGKPKLNHMVNHMENENENEIIDYNIVKKPKILKIEYGENVKLTADEYSKLYSEFGEVETDKAIKYLADYKIEKGYKTKSDYLTLRRWVFDAIKKHNGNTTTKSKTELFAESTRWAYELDAINAAKIMEQSDHENSYDLGSG